MYLHLHACSKEKKQCVTLILNFVLILIRKAFASRTSTRTTFSYFEKHSQMLLPVCQTKTRTRISTKTEFQTNELILMAIVEFVFGILGGAGPNWMNIEFFLKESKTPGVSGTDTWLVLFNALPFHITDDGTPFPPTTAYDVLRSASAESLDL